MSLFSGFVVRLCELFNLQKSGEGYGREEKDLPLDIVDHKLLQWLVSRGKVPVVLMSRLPAPPLAPSLIVKFLIT